MQKCPNLRIRLGTPDDYSRALEIQKLAYTLKEVPLYGPDLPPLKDSMATLAEEIRNSGKLLIGEIAGNGVLVASLRMKQLDNGDVYFGRLSVDPVFQGKGIGQRMVLAVEEHFPKARGYVLVCGVDSRENEHIYSKLGYMKTGAMGRVVRGPEIAEMRKPNPKYTRGDGNA